MLAAVSAQY